MVIYQLMTLPFLYLELRAVDPLSCRDGCGRFCILVIYSKYANRRSFTQRILIKD